MLENQLSRYGAVSKIVPTSPLGKVFYVINTSSALYGDFQNQFPADKDGVERVHSTIASAISATVAGRGDVIMLAPGTYTSTAALVPKANTSFIGMNARNKRAPSAKITSTTVADMIQLDVDDTYWEGIEFLAGDNTADNLVDIADSASVSGVTFHRCVFNGADRTTCDGLNIKDATNTTTGLVVTECLFRDFTGTPIDVGVQGMPYALIQNNEFALDVNSGTAIALADTTAFATGKGYAIIDNIFTGFDATANEVAITIAGTADTTGAGIIARNYFAYVAAAAITQDKLTKSEVNNYYGDGTTGGVLVDPTA